MRVIALAGLNYHVFRFRSNLNSMVAGCCAIGSVSQAVLIAQFLLNPRKDLINGLFFRNLKQSTSGFLRNALQDLFAVRTLFLWEPTPTASPSSSHGATHRTTHRPTHSATATETSIAVRLIVFEKDRVDDCVCALSCFDCALQTYATATIHAIREHDNRFAPFLFFH